MKDNKYYMEKLDDFIQEVQVIDIFMQTYGLQGINQLGERVKRDVVWLNASGMVLVMIGEYSRFFEYRFMKQGLYPESTLQNKSSKHKYTLTTNPDLLREREMFLPLYKNLSIYHDLRNRIAHLNEDVDIIKVSGLIIKAYNVLSQQLMELRAYKTNLLTL